MSRSPRRRTPPGTKWCPKCELIKPLADFRGGYCKDCSKAYHAEWSVTSRPKREADLRRAAVAHYGGHCSHCDENDPDLILVSPTRGRGQRDILEYLAKNNYPPGYILTCVVCERKVKARS